MDLRMCVRACVQYKAGLAGRKWTAGDEVTLFCVGKMADRRRRWSTGRERGDYTGWRS
jgi:hypothetical protein